MESTYIPNLLHTFAIYRFYLCSVAPLLPANAFPIVSIFMFFKLFFYFFFHFSFINTRNSLSWVLVTSHPRKKTQFHLSSVFLNMCFATCFNIYCIFLVCELNFFRKNSVNDNLNPRIRQDMTGAVSNLNGANVRNMSTLNLVIFPPRKVTNE